MAKRLTLSNTSSTGTVGDVVWFDPPVRTIATQTWTVAGTTGASVILVQGSINGENWSTVATTTNSGAATTRTSTSAHLISAARATLTAHSAGGPVNVVIVGA